MKRAFLFLLIIFLVLPLVYCNSNVENNNNSNSHNPSNNTAISFVQSEQTLGDTRSFGLAIADIDLDGDMDILFANYVGPSPLWLNDGNGNFTLHPQIFGTGVESTHDVDIADLNGDTYPDIFVANHDEPSKIYFNNGDGSFTESSQLIGSVGENPQTIQLADVDGDGDMDAYLYNISAPNRIWINDGTGHFVMRNVDYGGSTSHKQWLADFNGDSFPDLYISYRNFVPAEIWMNDGAGNFINSNQALGQGGTAVDFGDVDGDGDTDIIMGNMDITIWLNQNNTGTFIQGSTIDEKATRTLLFDADLDGDLDLATVTSESGNRLWINDGSGNFTFHGTIFGTARMFSIGAAKLDGGDDYDIVVGGMNDSVGNLVFFNHTTP